MLEQNFLSLCDAISFSSLQALSDITISKVACSELISMARMYLVICIGDQRLLWMMINYIVVEMF